MAVYKDGDKWRVIYRYTNYKGERKQTQKRGFATTIPSQTRFTTVKPMMPYSMAVQLQVQSTGKR